VNDQYLHPNPSDELLAARVVLRDVEAFTELYDRYARPVYAMTAHMLGSTDAEEIVQDVFLRLWNNVDQFDARRGSFKSWFMTIARHRVLDELRSRSQQQRFIAAEATDQVLANAEDPMMDVEREVSSRERGRVVLRALKTLPAEQRQVLVLAYFGGLSQSAIAQRLGWPLGTVKKRVRLGLQKLRNTIGPQEVVVADQSISTDVTS
jgi:RNA polymerase sigma-70 factor (ECF subfamily)